MKTALDFKHKLEQEIEKELNYGKEIEKELTEMKSVWLLEDKELDRFNMLVHEYKNGLTRIKKYEDALMLVKQFVRDLL